MNDRFYRFMASKIGFHATCFLMLLGCFMVIAARLWWDAWFIWFVMENAK